MIHFYVHLNSGSLSWNLLIMSLVQNHSFLFPFCRLDVYRTIQFRWYQGYFSSSMPPPFWALDNVYIGPSCPENCHGHGTCLRGIHCTCDPGHWGPLCEFGKPNPSFLKDEFEGESPSCYFLNGIVLVWSPCILEVGYRGYREHVVEYWLCLSTFTLVTYYCIFKMFVKKAYPFVSICCWNCFSVNSCKGICNKNGFFFVLMCQ